MTNREIASELMVSTKTVEYHLSNVYAKLGVRSRSELRARARAEELALYPFTAPAVIPSTILRLKNMNMISGGIVIRRMSAKSRLYCVLY